MSADSIIALISVLVVFFGLLAIRVHVGLSLMGAGVLGVVLLRGGDAAVATAANQPYSTAADYSLTIIPLFIVMGVFAVNAGLAQAGFDFASRVFGKIPGGSALASLSGSGLFAAVTGSSVATVATMARVSTDAIVKAGHGIRLAAGVVCAGGTLGVLIPPSIVLVLYGVVAGESIGQLLLGGLGPGLLTILAYAVTVMILVVLRRRRQERREAAALADRGGDGAGFGEVTDQADSGSAESGSSGAQTTAATATAATAAAATATADTTTTATTATTAPPKVDVSGLLYLGVIFTVSIGSIYLGVATPTEAASFGAMAALIIMLLRVRPPQWMARIKESMTEAVGLTAMTFLLMTGAGVFTYFLALSGASSALVNAVVNADMHPYVVLVLCLLLLLPLGMFLDGISMILISAPLLHPILTEYGFDGIWLGIIIVKVAEMALITPPVGMNAFVYSGAVPEAKLNQVFRGIIPFIVADLVVVALMIAIPGIVTFIPNLSSA